MLGAAQKAGTDDSCSTLETAINYQMIWRFPIDSCTTAESQIGILLCSFSSRKWELGPNLIKSPVTARYLTPQKALEIAALAQLSGKKKFSEQPSTNSSKANANVEISQVLFWDALSAGI